MPLNNGDPCFSCLQVDNTLPINETNTSLRVYRDVVSNINTWTIGDTIKIKDAGTYKFFGFMDASDLSGGVIVKDADNNVVGSTTSGQGTSELTVTLTANVALGDLIVCYRVGVPSTYSHMCGNKGSAKLNCHSVSVVGSPTYQEVFNKSLIPWGVSGVIKVTQVDGISLQQNPPI